MYNKDNGNHQQSDAEMTMLDYIQAVKIILCLFFLVLASYQDYKERRVSDRIFTVFMPIATALTLAEIALSTNPVGNLITFALYLGVSTILFYAVYFFGLFGGADAKMLIALSMAMPWPLSIIKPVLGFSFPVFPISLLNDSLLVTVLTLPFALASNLIWKMKKGQLFKGLEAESTLKKIGALIFCVKKDKKEIEPYHMIAEENGKITLFKKVQEEDITPEQVEKLPESVFITFSVPMIIFITIGFAASVLLGDMIIFLISKIL